MNGSAPRTGPSAVRGGMVGVALVLTLAACRSGGGGTAAPAHPLADHTLATGLVLLPVDLPAGWTATKGDDQSDAVVATQMAACIGATDPALQTAAVEGDEFHEGHAEVSGSVGFAPTPAAFDTDTAKRRGAKYESCFSSVVGRALRSELLAANGATTAGRLDVSRATSPTYGDATVVLHATMRTAVGSRRTVVYIDHYSYGKDRAEVDLSFRNDGAPFDARLEKALVAKATAKLGRAG